MYIDLHVKCPSFFQLERNLDFLNFLDRFPKNTQILNFIRMRRVGAKAVGQKHKHKHTHTHTHTNTHDETDSGFSQFYERA
jgi:hypothetical protein